MCTRDDEADFPPWFLIFVAETPQTVAGGLKRLAALMRRYLAPVLLADEAALETLRVYEARVTDDYSRRVHLGFLPKDVAERLKDAPLAEIICVRREREGW